MEGLADEARRSSGRTKVREPRGLFVESERVGAAGPGIERADERDFKLRGSTSQCHRGLKDLLLILDDECVGGEQALKAMGNLTRGLLQEAAQDPDEFKDGDEVQEARIFFTQQSIDDRVGAAGLGRVVLQQIAQDDVGVEADQRRERFVDAA